MRLKNKKTGIIHKIVPTLDDGIGIKVMSMKDGYHYEYKSLADFNKEWEDAPEEPKSYWFINTACDEPIIHVYGEPYEMQKETGNHFETREEAEKAVEKLKAWKRLKDKGFRFRDWDTSHHNLGVIEFFLPDVVNDVDEYRKDLDLLFGGEE